MEIDLPKNMINHHLAGIVPVDGQPLDFKFPWHDSLMPIGENFLAIENAVFNCAVAGCKSIWIVCPRDMQPLIRYRLGDWIYDPVIYYTKSKFANRPLIREIPIYYTPTHPKDVDRRTSLSWSIITGAQNAWRVGRKLSRYTTPDKYFVCFPYGLHPLRYKDKIRAKIRTSDSFYISYEDSNFKDGLYLPFTFTPKDFLVCRRKFRKNENKKHTAEKKVLPVSEQYTGRYFTHDFVFSDVNTENACLLEVSWYYDVSNWKGLRKWLGSENNLDKPADFLLSYSEWNPLGVDLEEEE